MKLLKISKKLIPTKMFFILVLIFFVPSQGDDSCGNTRVRNLTDTALSGTYSITEEVSRDKDFDLHIGTNLNYDGKKSIIVRSERNDQDEEDIRTPLYFIVSHSGSIKSWQVPSHTSSNARFAERVLCPLPGEQRLKISVSTDSTKPLRFNLTVSIVDFLLLPNQAREDVKVSPNAPSVLSFRFPDNDPEDNYLLKITNSSLAACTMVSVQNAQKSPYTFFDEESNIKFGSSYQTMLKKSAIIVSREKYPDGFYVILLVKTDNKDCYKKHEPTSEEISQHSINVTVVVESLRESIKDILIDLTGDIVIHSIILVFLFYGSLILFFFFTTMILNKCFGFELEGKYGTIATLMKKKNRQNETDTALTNIASLALQSADQVDGQSGPSSTELEPEKIPQRFKQPWWFWNQNEWQKQEEDVDDVDCGMVEEEMSRENRARVSRENYCTLDHNCQTLQEPHRQQLRSQLFSWLIVIAGIFYALPAFQLVYNHQNPFIQGGDLDHCYYNFFCVFPFGPIADFGHVFSNIGYIISGLYFILKVYLRKTNFERLPNQLNTGIPEQVGIFYALGGALALEGVLSGIYHICPTSANFQFDTTFMFLIAVLVFLKLYQFRHADTALTAQLVFVVIGVALSLEVVGYFTSHPVFWAVFIIVYIVFMLIFILKIYLNEKRFKTVFIRIFKNFFICCSSERKNIQFRSLIPCIIVIIINILMAMFFAISQRPGVSRYLLAILMVNMMLYESYYVCRKLHLRLRRKNWRENEGIRVITLIYLLMSVMFMTGACYFFIKELKTSAGTPAESRNMNDGCFLMIFDNHDMWHFLSAAGLYQHFMFLLTLEDYNIRYMKQRKLITVF